MKSNSKNAREKIKDFFEKRRFTSDEARKIKRLAMKHRIRLTEYRSKFCKKCYSDLRNGSVRISKHYKITSCVECKNKNRIKIS